MRILLGVLVLVQCTTWVHPLTCHHDEHAEILRCANVSPSAKYCVFNAGQVTDKDCDRAGISTNHAFCIVATGDTCTAPVSLSVEVGGQECTVPSVRYVSGPADCPADVVAFEKDH